MIPLTTGDTSLGTAACGVNWAGGTRAAFGTVAAVAGLGRAAIAGVWATLGEVATGGMLDCTGAAFGTVAAAGGRSYF